MKKAIFNKKTKKLTFWDSKKTTTTIDCRAYDCAKLVR